jgi:hypothetical protein
MANWANVDRLGNPLAPGWQEQNLAWIEPTKGQRWQVYKPAADAFNGLITDLIAAGYQPHSSGGFNYRNIRGGNKLSQHAFGTAIDINADSNPMLRPGAAVVTDLPANTAELAKKWGLEWGGTWSRPDAMHFEWAGGPGGSTGTPATPTNVAGLFAAPTAPAALQAPGTPTATPQQSFGQLALLFAQQQAQRQQQKQEEADAEQERRRALFSPDSVAGLFGAA